MGQRDYLASIKRSWVIILLLTLLGGGAGVALSARSTPIYTSTSKMFFTISYGNSANDLATGSTYTQNQMLAYSVLATTPTVLTPVVDRLTLDANASTLSRAISVAAPADTPILEITASAVAPETAADIANSVADSLAEQVELIAPVNQNGVSTVTARTIEEAEPPVGPSSPNTRLNIIAGVLLGLLAGVVIAILRDLIDTRIRTSANVDAISNAPVIGAIERDTGSGGLVVVRDSLSPSAESYRALRTSLQFVAVDSSNLTIVITSSLPNEGKSTVASNLALALAEAEQTVILVDADLRRGSIASYSGLEGAVGLTTVLVGRATLDDVVQVGGHPSLDVLPSGEFPPNPSGMLSSRAMVSLLDELRSRYDVVVIDAAPILAVADASVLSQFVDGVLVVADVTQVRRRHLSATLESLDRAGASVLGVVLNKVKSPDRVAYYGVDTTRRGRRARKDAPRDRRTDAASGVTPPISTWSDHDRRAAPRDDYRRRGTPIPESAPVPESAPIPESAPAVRSESSTER